jgi:hypothetical protein
MFLKLEFPTNKAIEGFQIEINNFHVNYESSNERALPLECY